MKTFAIVNSQEGYVSNVIVGNSLEELTPIMGFLVEITETTGDANIGYWWDGTTFSTAVQITPE
jgi:hypothetical protein